MSDPWFKFYPTDWKADNQLKLCSAAARGLWIEMLCICHESTPYGHLLMNGVAPTDAELSVLTGIPVDQISHLLAELNSRGVFSKTSKGVIYSRKLVRDDKKSKEGKKFGKDGGNPNLCNTSKKTNTLKGKDKGGDKTQKPEARLQKDYVFEGRIIRLLARDWDKWKEETELTDAELARFMDGRESFVSKLSEDDTRRVDWFWPTYQDLKNKAEGIRMSRS